MDCEVHAYMHELTKKANISALNNTKTTCKILDFSRHDSMESHKFRTDLHVAGIFTQQSWIIAHYTCYQRQYSTASSHKSINTVDQRQSRHSDKILTRVMQTMKKEQCTDGKPSTTRNNNRLGKVTASRDDSKEGAVHKLVLQGQTMIHKPFYIKTIVPNSLHISRLIITPLFLIPPFDTCTCT